MVHRFLKFIESLIFPSAAYGTPSNPEVLDPVELRQTFAFSKFRIITLLLTIMLFVSLPGLLTLIGSYWLFESAAQGGNILAGLVLFLTAPITASACLFGLFIDMALFTALMAVVRGKNVMRIQFGSSPFTAARSSYRDVTPENLEETLKRLPPN